MSRQGTRITRWLMGDPDEESPIEARESSLPRTTDGPAAPPPLPRRAPDNARPRVEGLRETTRDVRRRQLDDDPRHRAPTEAPPALRALRDDLVAVLEDAAQRLEGFHSAVLATAEGASVAHAGVTPAEAASLAESTSRMCQGMGLPRDALDVAAVSLTSGDIVVVASAEHAHGPLLLRLTLQGTAMGLAIVHAQRTATAVSKV